MLYVNPDDFNASDLVSNNGNSPTRPFKTIQRALLEVARFSYIQGQNNDKYDQFTINLSPGEYIIDNRPGKSNTAEVPELSDQSNFDITDPANDLVKFNSTLGGMVVPRGTSIVGMDLRKTRVRPRYVPNPADDSIARTSIFKVTGACYFWQFSLFDALPTSDVSGNGGVYNEPTSNTIVNSNYSHHKVTCFTYADQEDLDKFYAKAARAFASIPTTPGELESRTQENRIVGPLQQAGQKDISSVVVAGSLVTVVTDGPHEVFEGQQITIEDVVGSYSALNGTYYVTDVANDTTLTVTLNGLSPGNVPSVDLANAIVKAEIDTVDSSSPYIFNCSLRSTYGLCGLWADGSRVSGFKSMVVAQFTGVSLQKDDRAFVKFTETTTPNPSFVLEGGASDAVALHQDSTRGVYYRGDATTGWRHYHIRVSNNSFIQSVSVFAVGYAEQHLIESGGDYSITNSNSNFGTQALCADGFRPDSFTLDKKGKFTHIVPPQALTTLETNIQYYPLDVQRSKAGLSADSTGTKLFLFEQKDPSKTPVFDINNFKLGGKLNDKIFAKLTDPVTGRFDEFSAEINPSGIEEHNITNVNVADDSFTTASTNDFETATPIRIYSNTGYLPLGMESNRLYYAIKINNTSFKIAPSEEDARAGAGGDPNSIVNIRSIIPLGATLTVKAFVSDTNPELPRFNVSVNASNETFSTGTFPHGFTTGDKVFFRRRVIADVEQTGQLPQIQQSGTTQSLSLTTEYFVKVVDSYTFKIADTASNANNDIPIPIDAPGDSAQIVVYRNIQKSPLRYDPTQENWYVAVSSNVQNTIHPVLTSSNSLNIYANSLLTNTENVYMKRISDNRQLADRTYRMRYVIPKTELNARPPLIGYVVQRKTDSNNVIIPYNTNSDTNQTAEFDRIYFIYRSDTILRHIPGEQDGVYYLTILLADISPKGSQFNSATDTFAFLKYSQDVSKIYPDLDKDNPSQDPPAAVSVADNLVHGDVYQDDNRSSITKEAIARFIDDAGYNPNLNALTGKATSGQENRLISFNSNNPEIEVELRRTSQVRAGNQTFEYTGFGSGNYSTGFPSKQEIVLSDKEVLYSQSQRRRAGVVFYSGLNAYGDLYVGNQKINAITGEVEILDKPILRVAGSAVVVNEEYVPFVQGTRNVNIEGNIATSGGEGGTLANSFNNESKFFEGVKVATKDDTNRALISHDLIYRQKQSSVEGTFNNYGVKQTALSPNNLRPNPGVEGAFPGDITYKPRINRVSRHEGYIYVGGDATETASAINGDYRQIGLIGTGHLTSIEESYTDAPNQSGVTSEPYIVTGKFGINKAAPTASLHVGTGNVLFDNDLTVTGDVTINGGDLRTSASTFNYTDTSTTVNFASSATTMNVATSNAPGGAGTQGGSSVAIIASDTTRIMGDVEMHGKYNSGTQGDKTATITTTAQTTNFLTVPNTVNFSNATMNAFTGANNINIGNSTGTTTINHNLTVSGNLTVNGTTTYVNSTIVDLDDPIISVGGSGSAAGAPSSAANRDRGMELKYYSGSAQSAFMGLNVSEMKFVIKTGLTAQNFEDNEIQGSEGSLATLQLQDLEAAGNVNVDGDVNVDGEVHADRFELDATVNFNAPDNYFNLGMLDAMSKHSLPIGSVIMYSTSADTAGGSQTIPNGFAPCDGGSYTSRKGISITTPDMRGRFPLAASYVAQGGTQAGSPNTMGNIGEHQLGGSKTKQTTNATNANTLAIDTNNVSVGGHRLTTQELPHHRHGMNHGHRNILVEDFEAIAPLHDTIGGTSAIQGGSHSHGLPDMEHVHYFGGDDHLRGAANQSNNDLWEGNRVKPGGSERPAGEYDWDSDNDGEDEYYIYKTSPAKVDDVGNNITWNPNSTEAQTIPHTHTVNIRSQNICNAIEHGTGRVDAGGSNILDYQGNANTEEATRTGSGADHGVGDSNAPGGVAAEHNHTITFGGSSGGLLNRSHTHDIEGIAPPFYAITFLMKL